MFEWADGVEFFIMEIMPVSQQGAAFFNYFFTLISIFGLFACGWAIMIKLITRS